MDKNPFAIVDSVLEDWVSPRVRRTLHSLILIASILGALWVASEGNWGAFAGTLVAAFYAGSNRANTGDSGDLDH